MEPLDAIAAHVKGILSLLGEDVERRGLIDTPGRVARAYVEMFAGLSTPPPRMTTFPKGDNDEIVVERDIEFSSMCEHHLLPFIGTVSIGYLPKNHVLGLSKFGRVVDYFAARPQIQEVLTAQVAQHIFDEVEPVGVIVVVSAIHTCMSVRGVKKSGARTTTSAIRGMIDKREFFELLRIKPV